MPQRFVGKVAFITGGATGLGAAFGQALSSEGAAVALADIDHAQAVHTAATLDSPSTPALALACDVADERSVQYAVDDCTKRLGGVDILINNAARHLKKYSQPFSTLTHDEIRGLFDVNVMGIVNCCLACRPVMSERGDGVIVNMASSAAYSVGGPYGVSKLAVRGLTMAFAKEFAPDGIRVNAIAPTLTPTENVLAEFSEEEFDDAVEKRQLVHRRGTLDDVTRSVLFLCSDDAAFITGETIRVTGGVALSI